MKTRMVELKTVTAEGGDMSYADWLKNVLSRPANPQTGMTMEEQRKLLPILDLIDPPDVDIAPARIYLTEEQHKTVVAAINRFGYPGLNRLFVEFADHVEHAEEVEMKPREEREESA